MIANTIFAAGAFVSLVAAIPLAQPPFPKRDIVWETHTEVALTTIPVTVTHWLEPGETPPTGNKGHYGHKGHGSHGGYGQPPAQPETTSTAAPVAPASSPESTPQAPAPSSYEQPTSQAAPPPAAPTTQAPAPAPTTTQAAPPAYTPSPQPAPQPSPSQSSSGGSNGLTGIAAAGKSYTGDLTYYDPGLGACGITSGPDEAIVAISEAIFDAYDTGNPNNNPLCGKYVTITGEDGSPYKAKIVDRCTGCAQPDLDLSPGFFKSVVPTGDGRVPGMSWTFD